MLSKSQSPNPKTWDQNGHSKISKVIFKIFAIFSKIVHNIGKCHFNRRLKCTWSQVRTYFGFGVIQDNRFRIDRFSRSIIETSVNVFSDLTPDLRSLDFCLSADMPNVRIDPAIRPQCPPEGPSASADCRNLKFRFRIFQNRKYDPILKCGLSKDASSRDASDEF
jgi:hypothetical protein